jgi:hypothetical protein
MLPADRTRRPAGRPGSLDICVPTQQSIVHGDILVDATPIGGFRIDGAQRSSGLWLLGRHRRLPHARHSTVEILFPHLKTGTGYGQQKTPYPQGHGYG